MRRHAYYGAALAVLGSSACLTVDAATQLMVVVDADEEVAATLTRIEVTSSHPTSRKEADRHSFVLQGGADAVRTPFSFAVTKADVTAVLLIVTGFDDDDEAVIERRVYVRFVANQLRKVVIALSSRCLEVICSELSGPLTSCDPMNQGLCLDIPTEPTTRIAPQTEFDALE